MLIYPLHSFRWNILHYIILYLVQDYIMPMRFELDLQYFVVGDHITQFVEPLCSNHNMMYPSNGKYVEVFNELIIIQD